MISRKYEKTVAWGFATFILLLVSFGLASLWNLWDINESNARLQEVAYPLVKDANKVQIQLLKLVNLSSLAASEDDVDTILEYQDQFFEGSSGFSGFFSDLSKLSEAGSGKERQIQTIQRSYNHYVEQAKRVFRSRLALQNINRKIDAEAVELVQLTDQVGASLTDIIYFQPTADRIKDMELIAGHANQADSLMVGVIKTVREIQRSNDQQRVESAYQDFNFVIDGAMNWFDRAVPLFRQIDPKSDQLIENVYTNVANLRSRLNAQTNLLSLKQQQFSQKHQAIQAHRSATADVNKCIDDLDRLLVSADSNFEVHRSELQKNMEFGYVSITATLIFLITLATIHFNSLKATIKQKITDLASINRIARSLSSATNPMQAIQTTLDEIRYKTGLSYAAGFVLDQDDNVQDMSGYGSSERMKGIEQLDPLHADRVREVFSTGLLISGTSYGPSEKPGNANVPDLPVSYLYVPLQDTDSVTGVLCLAGQTAVYELNDNDHEYFLSLAANLMSNLKNLKMREIIEQHNRSLEDTVRERTAALKQKSDDIVSILNNMHQGLFTISEDGYIDAEFAPYLETIFETRTIANQKFTSLLFRRSFLSMSQIDAQEKLVTSILGRSQREFDMIRPRLITALDIAFEHQGKSLALSWDPICDESGCVIKLIVTVRDITEHQLAQQQKEILATIFKNSSEPVVVFDAHLAIKAVNAAFSELVAIPEQELIDTDFARLFEAKHDEAYFRQIRHALDTQNRWEGEIRCESTDSNEKLHWLTLTEIGSSKQKRDRTYLGSFSDVLQRQKVEDELRYLANYDALTNLPNRRLFTDRIQHALSIAKRNATRVALLFIDLNRFKFINDTYGHTVGDALLIEVTLRLKGIVRQSDTLCRLGGDEFTVLIENPVKRDDIEKVAVKILQEFHAPFEVDGQELRTGASIGISIYPDNADSSESLMVNADVAMYAAKDSGAGYQFFESYMNESSAKRMTLENDLHRALDNNELFLVYQPKFELKTGQMIGAEVLLRWQHPVLGLVSPDQFIPLAEETGLIIPIGQWVVDTVCDNIVEWKANSLAPLNLAVNVSAKQFQSVDFIRNIQATLARTGIDPVQLEFEVTESLLMDTGNTSIGTLYRIKDLGIRISIDDFGTGYSSLQYLSKFPIDYVKIDRTFVMGLDAGGKSIAIIRAIIAMAQGLDLQVIAEGVEYESQARVLREFGCQFAQGFLYSKPLKEEDFRKHLSPSDIASQLTFLRNPN